MIHEPQSMTSALQLPCAASMSCMPVVLSEKDYTFHDRGRPMQASHMSCPTGWTSMLDTLSRGFTVGGWLGGGMPHMPEPIRLHTDMHTHTHHHQSNP